MNLSLSLSFSVSVSVSLFASPQKDEPDAFKELGTGNRIATWLFYVSIFPGLTLKQSNK